MIPAVIPVHVDVFIVRIRGGIVEINNVSPV